MAKKEKELKEKKQKSRYLKDTKAELKKVIWPTPKQLVNNTLAVIGFTLIIAVIVFVLDLCFDSINKYGVTALQQKIQSSYNSSKEEKNEEAESESDEEKSTDENTESGNEVEVEVEKENTSKE